MREGSAAHAARLARPPYFRTLPSGCSLRRYSCQSFSNAANSLPVRVANAFAGSVPVFTAIDLAVKAIGGNVQESTWHALDAAQAVPFRTLDLGPDLAQRSRTVAVGLATAAQQPAGTRANDPDPLAPAGRHLRAAGEYLGNPTLSQSASIGEKPVKLADQLADTLHGLAARATTSGINADAKDHLRDTGADLAEANRLSRLCDPAAPVGGNPTPPEADRRFRRHYLLLAHAKRIDHRRGAGGHGLPAREGGAEPGQVREHVRGERADCPRRRRPHRAVRAGRHHLARRLRRRPDVEQRGPDVVAAPLTPPAWRRRS